LANECRIGPARNQPSLFVVEDAPDWDLLWKQEAAIVRARLAAWPEELRAEFARRLAELAAELRRENPRSRARKARQRRSTEAIP
jgi:hypothetical protein